MKATRMMLVLLALVMVLGMLSVTAFATDSADTSTSDLTVQITHVSLNPAKDALGFKAKVEGSLELVTEIGFAFRVNGGAEKVYTLTKTPEDGIFTARVQNILANKGGEATLEAYAFVKTADATVKSEWQSTSMKQALQAVDAVWHTAGYTQAQKLAVKALCNQYKAQVEPWALDNIFGGFFGSADGNTTATQFDLSADTGANTGTVNVSENGISLGYVDSFREENFYFESKIHISSVKSTENYPKFGLFVRGSDSVRHNFYVDMNTDLTATVVGRMTNTDGSDNWTDINTATISTLAFSGEGEYITMGVLKDGKYLHLFVDGAYILTYESEFTGAAMTGFFGFNTSMTLTEYFTDTSAETIAAKKALIPRYIVTKGGASVMSYDAATDTITIDMDSSSTRNQAQLVDNGIAVEAESFAITGHIKVENTKTSGSASSQLEFQIAQDSSNFLKMTVYRYGTTGNSVYINTADAGNGSKATGFAYQKTDGSFETQSGHVNNLVAGDPYEVDYKVIFEDGVIYLELDGVLVYKFQSTFTNAIYYFGVTAYADATYTNTQVTYDAEEIAAMTAAYSE